MTLCSRPYPELVRIYMFICPRTGGVRAILLHDLPCRVRRPTRQGGQHHAVICMSAVEGQYRHAPAEGKGDGVCTSTGEFTMRGTPHLAPPAISPGEQPQPTSASVGDAKALPARHSRSFEAEPLRLSILMAVYNEESTIARAIDEVLKIDCPCQIELIVVDDGSTDATSMLLSRVDDPRVIVHRHPSNQGKGAALLAGASLATGTHLLPFDADLEYAPEDIPRMLEPVLKGRCDVVYGVRVFGCNTVYQTYLYAVGNRLLTRMANILFNAHLTDLHTCLKLMPLAMLRNLKLREKGFGLDSEITAWLLRKGIRPFEVPVSYYGRSHSEGKKIAWRDGVTCARILLRIRLRGRARRKELANDLLRERERSRAVVTEADPEPGEHVPSLADGSGDEFIAAVTG
jgi:glycosyltransferase involved in cell wall biosynthesis